MHAFKSKSNGGRKKRKIPNNISKLYLEEKGANFAILRKVFVCCAAVAIEQFLLHRSYFISRVGTLGLILLVAKLLVSTLALHRYRLQTAKLS